MSKRVSARAPRRARPCRSRSAGSAASLAAASASAAASRRGTTKPVTPSATFSGRPPASEQTTGSPIACASITATPKASVSDGWRSTSAQRQQLAHLVRAARAEQLDVVLEPEVVDREQRRLAVVALADDPVVDASIPRSTQRAHRGER